MLSVCIPVYNYSIRPLTEALSSQLKTLQVPAELIIIDDGSDPEYKSLNQNLVRHHQYIELPENTGRARIRNLFPHYAQYENLLFLDCDSLVISPSFLSAYADFIQAHAYDVVCGGRVYPAHPPGRNKRLRWKYGWYKESRPTPERQKHPNKSFMTNNFLIRKSIFAHVQFDERLRHYGHEDTLFGYNLKKHGINISHIENPVLNGNIEDNKAYLEKTEQAIENLAYIMNYLRFNPEFMQDVTLLQYYQKLLKMRSAWLINALFTVFGQPFRYLLEKGFASLWLFSFYKLGLLIRYR